MMRLLKAFAVLALVLECARAMGAEEAWTQAEPASLPLPLKVVKAKVLNSRNEPVHLRGVNCAGLEWSSNGEGHILDTIRTALRDWHVNVIRLPLAQDRWFGKAPEQKDGGEAYRALVRQVVDTCAAKGCYVVLDLHWSDAGEWGRQIGQHVMPDQNSVTFWKDLAAAYRNHPAVIFDLYNEPHSVSWDVWRQGGQVTEKDQKAGTQRTFEAVGMQTLLETVRGTGARNVVLVGGLDWAYDLSGILAGKQLSDPEGQGVIYTCHAYPFKGDTVEKWIAKMEAATKTLAVNVSEFGSDSRGGAGFTGEQWVRRVVQALQDHDWDWIAWDLHPMAGPCLVSDWSYTPSPHFGTWVQQALAGKLPLSSLVPPPQAQASGPPPGVLAIGMFDNQGDVGEVLHPGSAVFDVPAQSYTVSGSGENMWSTRDAFHFVWKKASGDLALTADISFIGTSKQPHRKACLMFRQSLDADAAYVDVALHGDGLTSLQFRDAQGAATHEVQANVSAPTRLRLEKRGQYALLYLAAKGEELHFSGAAVRLPLQEPFYVGLGVCAHNKDAVEKAVFANVEGTAPLPASTRPPVLYSMLETQTISSTDRRVIHVTPTRIEAPNWLRDGAALLFNSGGRIYRIPVAGGRPEVIDTGFATRCNNDHGVSPDGTLLAISDQSQGQRRSLIYTLPISGGTPRLITPTGPSYWHGWSPDGKTLVFCGERNGNFDIYTIPAAGGPETRLTTAEGLDDGPEYAPDGRFIYFNSERTGTMQIWRMRPDGSEQEQVTADEYQNWFPHLSPNGRYMTILSFDKSVTGHPANKDVTLRLMTLSSKKIDVLGRFLGGQGTINVPCWSPDSRRIAFVTYHLIP
jgi:Tol biopolymer transport system component